VFRPFVKGASLAFSPTGRRVIKGAVTVAKSKEARRLVDEARKLATSPESRKLVDEVVRAASHAGKSLATAENRERVWAAARFLADHRP
jgi:hypothetical protein